MTSETTRPGKVQVLVTLILLVSVTQLACYNNHFISRSQLEKLEATVEQRNSVAVVIDGCDAQKGASLQGQGVTRVAQAEGGADAAPAESKDGEDQPTEGIDPETGCATVRVNTASPIRVLDTEGNKFRVTPFNFAVTDTQLVSPDYDLLLPIDQVEGAEVETFSGLKTGLFIGGVAAAAIGGFLFITLTAGEERGFGN